MFGEVHFQSLGPLRLPHWRLNRVMEMLRHRPQPLMPRWADDHPIRAYRCALISLAAAGADRERVEAVHQEFPAICQAHRFHYSTEVSTRQEIEARLLTAESYAEIAARFEADPQAIEYYQQIFFDVRDRLQYRDWIAVVIQVRARHEREWGCSLAEAQRGHALRLLAFCGGSLVVDAIVHALAQAPAPSKAESVAEWCDDALGSLVRTTALAAATTFEWTDANKLKIIRAALRMRTSKSFNEITLATPNYEAMIEQATTWRNPSPSGPGA